jgi:hypothetical protein
VNAVQRFIMTGKEDLRILNARKSVSAYYLSRISVTLNRLVSLNAVVIEEPNQVRGWSATLT